MIEIEDGSTPVRMGDKEFTIDLVGWLVWYSEESETHADKPMDMVRAVKSRLKTECGIDVNYTEADAFLVGILRAYRDLKKKQLDEPTSAPSTESTPSD